MSIRKTLSRMGSAALAWIVPESRMGDRFIAFVDFLRIHRRLPGKGMIFNDVLYRVKTTDEIVDPLRVFVTDKEFVKLYVGAVIGDEHNVPTLTVLRSMEEVRACEFPDDCCIKPTHASGTVILRKAGAPIDYRLIESWFATNYYRVNREANYRTLKPKVIVEPLLFGDTNVSDYKFFCYRGRPRIVQVDVDRYIDHRRKFFDMKWNELDFSIIYPRTDQKLDRPANLDTMVAMAARLSAAFDFVRVDLYSDGSSCLVGEITNCSENVTGRFIPTAAEPEISRYVFAQD